jgi:hypothetical protein
MVDPFGLALPSEGVIADPRPRRADPADLVRTASIVQLTGLLAESVALDTTGGEQQVCVVVAVVAPRAGRVHRDVHGYAVSVAQRLRHALGRPDPVFRSELFWQGDHRLPGDARVPTRIGDLSGIPELFTAPLPPDQGGVLDPTFAGVVVELPRAFIVYTLTRPVCRCGRRGSAG